MSKDNVISNTATATMRQLVTALFERMVAEERLLLKEGQGNTLCFLLCVTPERPFLCLLPISSWKDVLLECH